MGNDRDRPAWAGKSFLHCVADVISAACPNSGFALLVFPFGKRAAINYISNTEPADMAEQLHSIADRLQRGGRPSEDHPHAIAPWLN